VLAPLRHRRQVLDEEQRQRVLRPERRGFPAELRCALRAAAVHGFAHVHAAPAHRGDVRREVVALHDEVADPAAGLDEARQVAAPATRAAVGRPLFRRVADRQQLDVILVVERDRVVRALARVRAALLDVEPDPAVLIHAPLEIRNANHDVIYAGEHEYLRRGYYRRKSLTTKDPKGRRR
jgi:hypothetical protein